jgi:hypothetical protein
MIADSYSAPVHELKNPSSKVVSRFATEVFLKEVSSHLVACLCVAGPSSSRLQLGNGCREIYLDLVRQRQRWAALVDTLLLSVALRGVDEQLPEERKHFPRKFSLPECCRSD